MPGQGNTQGPGGKVPFIFYSLSLLKGSRAIRETHGCDDFPWLSVAAGWGSLCDEWSGKKNGGRRADWKESKKEKSRRESGIKDSKGKTRGGSADCLLASCQLFPFPVAVGGGSPCSAPCSPSKPQLAWGCLPFPPLQRHWAADTSDDHKACSPAAQGQTEKSRNSRKPQTEHARVYLYIAEDLQSGSLHVHTRATVACYNCTCLLQTQQAFIPRWKFPSVKSEPLSEEGLTPT